jgi:hypothetical protein
MKNNKQAKINKVVQSRMNPRLRSRLLHQVETVQKTIEQTVSPDLHEPMIFPAAAPGRAGSARFPLVLEFNASAIQNSFGIIVRPSFETPVQVSSSTVSAPTADPIVLTSVIEQNVNKELTGECLGRRLIGEKLSEPLILVEEPTDLFIPLRAGGNSASTFEWVVYVNGASSSTGIGGTIQLYAITDTGFAQAVSVAQSVNTFSGVKTVSSLSWATNYRYLCFRYAGYRGEFVFNHCISPTGNSDTFDCGPIAQNLMDVYTPEWGTLLSQSERYRITAMDCLLTYTGPVLLNEGVVAVANTDSAIAPKTAQGQCSFYRAINELAFDRYNGRLASSGETEGGAHWYYAPDDINHLTMDSTNILDNVDLPAGIFGVEGMNEGGQFTLTINICVNFFSTKPEYKMEIQPSIALYNTGLSILRTHVPVVSSNDSHMKKFKKAAKGAGSMLGKAGSEAFRFVRDNPDLFAEAALMLL